MRASRRAIIKAGAAGAVALGSGGAALAAAAPVLVVFDSRIGHSQAFAAATDGQSIDVAQEHGRRWQALRRRVPDARIVGLTRWQDYILVRGLAQEQRLRLVSERRRGSLVAFELA